MLKKELANLICFIRLLGGISFIPLAFVGRQSWIPIVASVLFISDLLDGWSFRKFSAQDPPRHWFNRLPISMDQLADLMFTMGGIVYIGVRNGNYVMATVNLILAIAIALQLATIMGYVEPGVAHKIANTSITYDCFFLMVVDVIWIWFLNSDQPLPGVIITLGIFYVLFFLIEPRDRWTRS